MKYNNASHQAGIKFLIKGFEIMFFIIMPLGIFCQTNSPMIGVEGGSGASFFRNYFFSSIDGQPAFNYVGGLYVQVNLSKTLSLKTVVAMHEKGFYEESSINGKYFMFLDIPVLLKIFIGSKKYFYFATGPYFAYMVSAKAKDSFSTGVQISNRYNDFRHFDGGLALGFGAMFPLHKRLYFSLEIKNEYGFCNIREKYLQFDHHNNPYYNITPYYTNSTTLNVGLAYSLDKKH
jgi:hypothetical protein